MNTTNNLENLSNDYYLRLSQKGRFIKRNNVDFINLLMSTEELSMFTTCDEKLWALKNRNYSRPLCYCGKLTNFHKNSATYHLFCSVVCSASNPKTSSSRIQKRLVSNWAAKAQATILKRYGKDSIKEMRQQGVINKYGVSNYFATTEFKNRNLKHNLKTYGVTTYSQTQEYKDKYKTTCIARYGANHYNQSEAYKASIDARYTLSKASLNEKYGVEHSSQIKIADVMHLISDNEWLHDQYITQNKSTAQLVDELGISATTVLNYLRKHEIGIKYNFGYSFRCLAWLTDIAIKDGIYIQHAFNEGEYCIPSTKYRADGYCKDTNTIYEFHGDIWHGNLALFNENEFPNPYSSLTAKELYTKTIEKEQKIRDLGYNLVVCWEKDWMDKKTN
jgi:hypothetical protein